MRIFLDRLLYAIGGFDGKERLSSVECYHPENDEWTMVSAMKCSRSGAGVASLSQYIYVIGGYDGNSQLNSVERYDTERDIWEYVSNVSIARSALSVTVLDGKLYAMGKYSRVAIRNVLIEPQHDTTCSDRCIIKKITFSV